MSSPVSPGSLIGLSASLTGLSITFVSLRFYIRKVQNIPYRLDDWCIIPALLCLIASAITYIIGAAKYELGASTDNTLPGAADGLSSQIVYGYKAEFIALVIQPWLLGFAKISIVLFYRRIFCTSVRTKFSVISAGFIGLTVVWVLAFFFAIFFSCGTDISASWGSFEEFEAHCDNTILLDECYSAIDFILDLVVFVMPLPLIWRLQMSTQRRLAVSLVFVVGALAVVASCLRMAIVIIIGQANGQETKLLATNDPSLQTATILYWTMLEGGLAVIVACLPTLRGLFSKTSVESIVRSVRSTFSLDSLRSPGSGNSGQNHRGRYPNSDTLDGLETAITKNGNSEINIEAQGDLEDPIPMTPQRHKSDE